MKLSDLKETAKRTFLFYGEAGVGKTCLAASFPGPIKYFDFDSKVSSAASHYSDNKELLENIDVEQYPAVGKIDNKSPFMKFAEDLNKFDTEQRKDQKYKTAVFDSFTALLYMVTQEEMRQLSDRASKRTTMLGVSSPDLNDYGTINNYTLHLVNKILSIPIDNIIFIAHLMQDKDESTGVITYTLQATPALRSAIPKLFQEVYRIHTKSEAGKTKRFAQTQGDRRFVARSQISKLKDLVEVTNSGYGEIEKCL